MLGTEDRSNVSRRVREGWELVRATDLPPEWQETVPTMDREGRHAGVVYNEGLLLAKILNETVLERNEYYSDKLRKPKRRWITLYSTKLAEIAVTLSMIRKGTAV